MASSENTETIAANPRVYVPIFPIHIAIFRGIYIYIYIVNIVYTIIYLIFRESYQHQRQLLLLPTSLLLFAAAFLDGDGPNAIRQLDVLRGFLRALPRGMLLGARPRGLLLGARPGRSPLLPLNGRLEAIWFLLGILIYGDLFGV